MKGSTVFDSSFIEFPKNRSEKGSVTAINNLFEIPFEIKRVYYLYDIPGGEARGGHAHIELQQLIIAVSGSFDLVLDDSKIKKTYHLNRPYQGVLMPPGLWREIINFSSSSICLVCASHTYSEEDYIRNYQDFINYKRYV
jgi:dTDP-4-dehydrorhamnose 3,5-epimerase-like enzyme